jgi:hypothetical protein
MLYGQSLADVWVELVVLLGFAVLTSILASLTLRKRAA